MKTMKTTKAILLCGVVLVILLAPSPVSAQETEKEKVKVKDKEQPQPFRFEFKHRPSFRIGKAFRLDVRAKVQTDFRTFSPEVPTDEGTFDLHRSRLSIEGDAFKFIEYEVERDFRSNIGSNDQQYPWKDVYINFKYFDKAQLKVGKFKIPFSLDELTGEQDNDFALRSRIADDLAPGRDVGAMLHGRFFKRGVSYYFGVFQHDGENSRPRNDQPFSQEGIAARVTAVPFRKLAIPNYFKLLELGAAFTRAKVPEGLSGVRGHTVSGDTYFPYVYLQGPRERFGLEENWVVGRFSLQSEFITMREARQNQSVLVNDLPQKISRGWYATGTWLLTGENKASGVVPKQSFLDGGYGAVELAARYEQTRFGTADQSAEGFTSPRSPVLRSQSDRVWTTGINWYPNRYVKVQLDAFHEKIEQAFRSPLPGHNNFWTGILRLQFAM